MGRPAGPDPQGVRDGRRRRHAPDDAGPRAGRVHSAGGRHRARAEPRRGTVPGPARRGAGELRAGAAVARRVADRRVLLFRVGAAGRKRRSVAIVGGVVPA